MVGKIRMSGLTPASEKKLIKKMSDADLLFLCRCSGEVQRDARTIESFREEELKMCEKYGFRVK